MQKLNEPLNLGRIDLRHTLINVRPTLVLSPFLYGLILARLSRRDRQSFASSAW